MITEESKLVMNPEVNVVLRVEEASKVYQKGAENEVKALRGVSFEVKRGEMIAIMGTSGSGKTTLLNLLGGLDNPTSGKVYLEETDISTMSAKQLTQIRRHKIGFLFQSYNLIPVLTAYENVELQLLISGFSNNERRKRTNYLLETVGLKDRKYHKPDELSGGQKQRVAIARALANCPAIVLCDEPTGDLDSKNGQAIMDLLVELNQAENQTVVVVTHDPNIGRRCQKIYYLKDGQIDRVERRS